MPEKNDFPAQEQMYSFMNGRCPYCAKQMKSPSGFTLHIRQCSQIRPNIQAAVGLKIGTRVKYQAKHYKITKIKDGLVLMDGVIGPASKVTISKEKEEEKIPTITIVYPKNANEWVKGVWDRDTASKSPAEKRNWVLSLYRLTGYARHMKWTIEDVTAALDKLTPKAKK